jgi:hypothetical protein
VREKAHQYAIARGSILEAGAAIDLVRARGLASEADCLRARKLCARVGQMLNGLVRAMERRRTARAFGPRGASRTITMQASDAAQRLALEVVGPRGLL